jgi:hypothetical protein
MHTFFCRVLTSNHMTLTIIRLPGTMNPTVTELRTIAIDISSSSTAKVTPPPTFKRVLGQATESTAGDLSEASSISSYSSSDEEEEQEDQTTIDFHETVESSQPRKSILKISSEEIPVCTRRSSWKILPQPDMESIRKNVKLAAVNEDEKRLDKKSIVRFEQVWIREYAQTLGDNPSVSYGPPITLDWFFQEMEPISLEAYEAYRGPRRRTLRQMCMNYYTRRNLLLWIYSLEESALKKATKEAERCKRERAITKYFLPCSKVEDFIMSAGRKAKRAVTKEKA